MKENSCSLRNRLLSLVSVSLLLGKKTSGPKGSFALFFPNSKTLTKRLLNFGRNGEESLLRSVKDSSLSFLPKLMMSAYKLWAVKRSQLAEGDSPQLISTHPFPCWFLSSVGISNRQASSYFFMPGGYIPTLETKQGECWKFRDSRC